MSANDECVQLLAEPSTEARINLPGCHRCQRTAPGEERADWALGMRPTPPELVKAAAEWELVEIQWIVTNGIKMTGMPSFGEHHSTEEIADIAAFVNELPGMTPEDYAALSNRGSPDVDNSGAQTETASEPDAPEAAADGERGTPPAEIELRVE